MVIFSNRIFVQPSPYTVVCFFFVNTGSDSGMVPSGNKPSPEP